VRLADSAHDRQAESRSLRVRLTREALEGLREPRSVGGVDRRPGVLDTQLDRSLARARADVHEAAGPVVPDAVLDQVGR
jgi:hypothetical protein